MNENAAAARANDRHVAHVLPVRTLLVTAAALFALTAVTVATSRLELGTLNVVAALAIACGKAAVVALFFMHLKYANRFQLVILVVSALFAVLLVSFVVFDTTSYQADLRAKEAQVRAKGP